LGTLQEEGNTLLLRLGNNSNISSNLLESMEVNTVACMDNSNTHRSRAVVKDMIRMVQVLVVLTGRITNRQVR